MLFIAVRVNEDIELVNDGPDPDGAVRLMVSCWNSVLGSGEFR
jgi:hypothetical protein